MVGAAPRASSLRRGAGPGPAAVRGGGRDVGPGLRAASRRGGRPGGSRGGDAGGLYGSRTARDGRPPLRAPGSCEWRLTDASSSPAPGPPSSASGGAAAAPPRTAGGSGLCVGTRALPQPARGREWPGCLEGLKHEIQEGWGVCSLELGTAPTGISKRVIY
ncbi:oxysterol-binding protein 1-like [Falco rusticolus]|uniref:oxysterol-binding protein 1-like n=1 Tax=Falco rusticolus TaxID=120794 RepID=UPI0018865C5C|nr:oxysterol-binding protein 1-like [Falco rusticolus]